MDSRNARANTPVGQTFCMNLPRLRESSVTEMATPGPPYEVTNRFHSQGIAAGSSALLDAINKGKVHLAKFILDAGENDVVNTRDFKGKTPLIRACYIKEEKTRGRCVELLLQRGADVNLPDDSGRTCLSYACDMRCNDVIKQLVKNNVDPDIPDKEGNTPLIYAAQAGNDTAIEILIKSFRRLGLNVDYVNNTGLTALLIASKAGYFECASLLAMEGRACISFRDRERGMNAEEWAREQGATTPEVLPFSTKFHQSLAMRELRRERPKSARGRTGSDTISQAEIDAQIQSLSAGGRHLDIDELTKRLLHVATQTSATNLKDMSRDQHGGGGTGSVMTPADQQDAGNYYGGARHVLKRGSMPTLKISLPLSTAEVKRATPDRSDVTKEGARPKEPSPGRRSPRHVTSPSDMTSSPASASGGKKKPVQLEAITGDQGLRGKPANRKPPQDRNGKSEDHVTKGASISCVDMEFDSTTEASVDD